jgi:hypothetical protein
MTIKIKIVALVEGFTEGSFMYHVTYQQVHGWGFVNKRRKTKEEM